MLRARKYVIPTVNVSITFANLGLRHKDHLTVLVNSHSNIEKLMHNLHSQRATDRQVLIADCIGSIFLAYIK